MHPQTPKPVSFSGLQGYCTGSAGDEWGTLYASLIGRKTALAGIWAAFQSKDKLQVLDSDPLRKRAGPDEATYHTIRTKLPDSGWQHMVLLHSQATTDNLPDHDFYVLSLTADVPIQLFWTQWNNALPFPAKPDWMRALWREGARAGLIHQLEAEGIHAWKVRAHADWTDVIQQIMSAERRQIMSNGGFAN